MAAVEARLAAVGVLRFKLETGSKSTMNIALCQSLGYSVSNCRPDLIGEIVELTKSLMAEPPVASHVEGAGRRNSQA
jgi:hypothetical protein